MPLAEIAILVHIGQLTAWWVPIAIVILTGVVGTWLANTSGVVTIACRAVRGAGTGNITVNGSAGTPITLEVEDVGNR